MAKKAKAGRGERPDHKAKAVKVRLVEKIDRRVRSVLLVVPTNSVGGILSKNPEAVYRAMGIIGMETRAEKMCYTTVIVPDELSRYALVLKLNDLGEISHYTTTQIGSAHV
jgi:hypothetical protein